MTEEDRAMIRRVRELRALLFPVLMGEPADVQGAALADAVSIWIVGHFADDPAQTATYREEVLQQHIELVRRMVPINAKVIEQMRKHLGAIIEKPKRTQ